MKYNAMNRRMFLQGSAGMLAIPFLPSLLPRAEAQTLPPSKYIHICSQYSLPRELSYPLYHTPTAVSWTQKDVDTKYQSLDQIVKLKGQISDTMDSSWNPYAKKMNIITNSHAYISSVLHTSSIYSTCSNGNGDHVGPLPGYFYSVDDLIERSIYKSGSVAIPTLRINLNMDNAGYTDTVCYTTNSSGVESKLTMLTSLQQIKQKITSNVSGTTTQTGVNRRALVDSVLQDYKRMQNHRRISSEDKSRLGNAMELWNQFLSRTPAQTVGSCNTPSSLDTSDRSFTTIHRAGIDAIVIALACGLTRNVMFTLLQGGASSPNGETLHGWSHDPRDDFGKVPDIEFQNSVRWRGQLVTYLLSQLEQAGLYDSTLVAWAHEYSSWGHEMFGHMLVQAGGANGRLELGNHIDAGGAPINRFHITNMQAMGLTTAEIERNGKPGFGEYANTSTGNLSDSSFGQPGNWRSYNSNRRDFFFQTAEKRRPYFIFKG
jgi:hypothetical protein